MSAINPKKVYRSLKSKGFVDALNKSNDHKRLELFHNNKLICTAKISHGKGDIREQLIRAMTFQCKLDKSQFLDLVNCPLSKEKYLTILAEKGELD